MLSKLSAEFIGTFWLVLGGCGSAVLAAAFPAVGIGLLGVSLAVGLTVLTGAYALGPISGGHFNPAITAGHVVAGRIRPGAAAAYAGAQLVGALAGAFALYGILRTLPGIADSRTAFDTVTAGFGEHSIIQAPLAAALLLEMLGAAIVVAVFLGTSGSDTRDGGSRYAAPVAVGLSFAVLLQLGQSVGNLPFNPARAIASAVFSSGWAVGQLWVFLAAPLLGAAIAGLVFRSFGAAADAAGAGAVVQAGTGEATEAGESAGTVESGESDGRGTHGRSTHEPGAGSSDAQEFFDGKRG